MNMNVAAMTMFEQPAVKDARTPVYRDSGQGMDAEMHAFEIISASAHALDHGCRWGRSIAVAGFP